MEKVLFICQHNSGRSQMAEEYMRKFGEGDFDVESAGLEPTAVNPLVIEVMREEGIDLSEKKTKSVFDLYKAGKNYVYVITVCGEEGDAKCPIFPGITHRLHLPFPDPSKVEGSREEKLAKVREIRDKIKSMVLGFIRCVKDGNVVKLTGNWESACKKDES